MDKIRRNVFSFLMLAMLLLTACEEGGEYMSIPQTSAQVVVLYNVYDLDRGMEVTVLPEMENVGLQDFPGGVTEGTPWVVRGTYQNRTCEDTLYLPEVKPGETAYCHINLFLHSADYTLTSQEEKLGESCAYAAIPEARSYEYQNYTWLENPTQALYYTTVDPDFILEDEIEELSYQSIYGGWTYEMLRYSLGGEHEFTLAPFDFYQSGWSLARLQRRAQDKKFTYTLIDNYTGRTVLTVTIKENNSVLIYCQEEKAHPECADLYRKGEGFGMYCWFIDDYDVPDRAGGGIFYDD